MPCKKFNGTLHIFPVMLYFWNSLSSVGVVQKHICSTASLQQENRRFTSIGNNDSIVNNAFSPAPTMPHWVWPRCGRHFRAFKPTRASSDNRSFALCDNPTIATTLYNSSLLWIQFLLYPKIDNVVLPSGWQKLVATTTNFNIATKERSFKTKIFVRVQTFRRRSFAASRNFCHPVTHQDDREQLYFRWTEECCYVVVKKNWNSSKLVGMNHIQICYIKLLNETETSLCMGRKFQTIFGPLCTLPGQNRTSASQRHPRQAQGLNGCPAQPSQCIDVPVSIISTIGAAPASMATTDSVGERRILNSSSFLCSSALPSLWSWFQTNK